MPKARTKTGHISVLAKCFSLFLLLVNAERTSCMELQGLPEWLSPVAERGLSAVWNEIPDDEGTDREKTLEIVDHGECQYMIAGVFLFHWSGKYMMFGIVINHVLCQSLIFGMSFYRLQVGIHKGGNLIHI